MNRQETIESALQQVQSGELSPAEATILLLAEEHGETSPLAEQGESWASLVNRLGVPPGDILEAWCQQLDRVAGQYEDETGEPLPAIDLHQWSITARGNFEWKGRRFDLAGVTAKASRTSIDRINQFRDALRGDVSAGGDRPEIAGPHDENRRIVIPGVAPATGVSDGSPRQQTAVLMKTEPTAIAAGVASDDTPLIRPEASAYGSQEKTDSSAQQTAKIEDPARSRLRPGIRRAMFALVLVGCVAIAGPVLHNVSQPENETAANNDKPSRLDVATSPAPEVFGSAESGETPPLLETLESITHPELESIETGVELEPSFSLDDLMPPSIDFIPPDDAAVVDAARTEPKSVAAGNARDDASVTSSAGPTPDSLGGVVGDDWAPDESPQKTRALTVMAVQLGRIEETDAVTELSESSLTGLELQFPFDVPLTMAEDDSEWKIRDERSRAIIAAVTSGLGGTQLRWTESAGRSSSATALTHGRITDADGGMIYLRPSIEADPWLLRVDQGDVMPTWNLRFPIPPRVARISVEFDLPEGIEKAWIEPIAPESLRRTRGLAVLRPKDDENVSLGVRLDIRCSRKLSCRLRYAGRLDSSMPWQIVSAATLAQFADQLTHQAAFVSKEATRLATVYELAGSEGKRILRVKRDRNDAQAEALRTASVRVAQLQTLIAGLEAEGTLRIRVWVDWPDAQQNLLTMQADDGGGDGVTN